MQGRFRRCASRRGELPSIVQLVLTREDGISRRLASGARGVSEELLNGAEIGSRVEKVRGEGVAQRVHREPSVLVDLLEELADHELHRAHPDARARAREKERGAIDLSAEHPRELIALR